MQCRPASLFTEPMVPITVEPLQFGKLSFPRELEVRASPGLMEQVQGA
jgi:hypothetical protein